MNPQDAIEATNWIPGIIALAVGAVGGIWAVLLMRRETARDTDTAFLDLEERAAHFIAQLRDLDEQRDRLDANAYVSEKSRLEKLAASALRARDGRAAASGKKPEKKKAAAATSEPASTPGLLSQRPQLAGFVYGAGTVAVVAGLWFLVTSESAPRTEGGSMTGNAQSEPSMPPAASNGSDDPHGFDPRVKQLLERLNANPKDVDAMNEVTEILFQSNAYDHAKMLNDRALSVAPDNKIARVFSGVVLATEGSLQSGVAAIDAVIKEDESFTMAWFYRGLIAMQAEDKALMKESWDKYTALSPDGPQKDRIKSLLASGGAHPSIGVGAPAPANPTTSPMRDELAKNPDDVDALVAIGNALLKQQRFNEARDPIQRALALAPKNPGARTNAAVLRGATGDPSGAVAALDVIVKDSPKYPQAWFFRGMFNMQSGNTEVAQESWRQFVNVAEDGPQKERIRGFLEGKGLQMPQ